MNLKDKILHELNRIGITRTNFLGIKYQTEVKNIIYICLLTPCLTEICKQTKKHLMSSLPKRTIESLLEDDIIRIAKRSIHSDKNIFINVPLSKATNVIPVFSEPAKSREFGDLVNVSTPESTFRTLVDITVRYYNKYLNTHTLCYSCRSGKDRTSVCDAVVQTTLYSLQKKMKPDYEIIRHECKKYLLFGLVISFYSTGIVGIKLNNMPVAKYILDDPDDYKFFLGNSRLSAS